MDNIDPEEALTYALENALLLARRVKPNDRSRLDRTCAVLITDLEKVLAYWRQWGSVFGPLYEQRLAALEAAYKDNPFETALINDANAIRRILRSE